MGDVLTMDVRTNTSADLNVRLRADEVADRTYHLTNHAEYQLTDVVLSDPQLPGGQAQCDTGRSIPPGGSLDCTASFTVLGGSQAAEVTATAQAPNRLPQAHVNAPVGYQGITAGLLLTRVGAPTGTGVAPAGRSVPEAAPSVSSRSAVPRVLTVVGGTVELRYRLEVFGDVPVTDIAVVEGLPDVGAVICSGPDTGLTLAPGQSVDCQATGIAHPGHQTGTARADGLADDATIGPDGSLQARRKVFADAPGAYDGLSPTPPATAPTPPAAPGEGTAPGTGPGTGAGPGTGTGAGAAPGTGAGGGTGTGTGTGTGAAPGTGAGTGTGAGAGTGTGTAAGAAAAAAAAPGAAAPGAGAGAGGGVAGGAAGSAGLLPVPIPAGGAAAAAPGQPAAAAAAGQLLTPFLPGAAPALLPGGTAFALPASPFAAPGTGGASTGLGGKLVGAGPANPGVGPGSGGTATPGPISGATAGQSEGAGPGAGASGGGQSPGGQAQAQPGDEDWTPQEGEDDLWDITQVTMLLLAILLPVLCVLAASFSVRGRWRR
ncbi:hypothetical protein ACIQF6_27830 [Kitasatospora sp. NPDC092948]|uniref:hypothetical protein n=1 Tax=Kitasatospora sp. NPDC092948 TaxID=3364088 RepID=UPI0038122F37